MSNFTFENQGTNTYLVYTVTPNDNVDSMSLGMLTNNKIQGLATTLFMQMDTTKYIKYNVSAKVSVKQFFAGPVNKKRLVGVFTGIVDAMLSAEEYMIDEKSILLDLDYIFADVSTCETVLICLPIMEHMSHGVDLGQFFKNIVFSTQFDQTENCDYVAKIINYLNSTPVFSLTGFNELLKDIEKNGITTSPVVTQPVIQQTAQPVAQQSIVQQPVVQSVVQQPVQQSVVKQEKPTATPVKLDKEFSIPKQPLAQAQEVAQQEQPVENNGKKMSMFYLLQHYSKENAAIYKAQKEKKEKKNKKGKSPAPESFTIPGAPAANADFAIPGAPATLVNQQQSVPKQPVQQPVQQLVQQKPVQQKPVQQPVQSVVQPQYIPPQPVTVPGNFGETTVLGGGGIGETTVLNLAPTVAAEVKPYLFRSKNNEKIILDKPVFRIGKEKSYVDYFIGDNTAISRSHANIVSRDGEYFVVDTNSTNHTYIDGVMVQSNVETKLMHGAKVRFANEDFVFYTH